MDASQGLTAMQQQSASDPSPEPFGCHVGHFDVWVVAGGNAVELGTGGDQRRSNLFSAPPGTVHRLLVRAVAVLGEHGDGSTGTFGVGGHETQCADEMADLDEAVDAGRTVPAPVVAQLKRPSDHLS